MSVPVPSEDMHIVEKIHKRALREGKERFLVEWHGSPMRKDFTWEPREHLEDCSLFHDFVESEKMAKKRWVNKKRKRSPEEEKKILVKLFVPTQRETFSDKDRMEIIARQSMRCNLCLTPFQKLLHDLTFEIDHIIPLEQGGSNAKANLQGLCPSCHIYKTTVLDKGVIARLLQASKRSGINPTRTEVLEQCQIMYRNRNRKNAPHHEHEMIEFAIEAREILAEMCKRKVNRMLRMRELMDPNASDESQETKDVVGMRTERVGTRKNPRPPTPMTPMTHIGNSRKRRRISKSPENPKTSPVSPMSPLEHLAFLIEQMEWLGMESSTLRMPNFRLVIELDLDNKKKADKSSAEFRKELNEFFRVCMSGVATHCEKNIQDIRLVYNPRE